MFNFIIDKLPSSLFVDGIEYEIYTDFRRFIAVETMMQDSVNLLGIAKETIVNIIFKDLPHSIDGAFSELMDFMVMYDNVENEKSKEIVFDWYNDGGKVYSAFMKTYSINLRTIDTMHWWEFRSLMKDLDRDCLLLDAMMYRGYDLSKVKDRDEKNRIIKMKSFYELR